jgi:hypothetical protein
MIRMNFYPLHIGLAEWLCGGVLKVIDILQIRMMWSKKKIGQMMKWT